MKIDEPVTTPTISSEGKSRLLHSFRFAFDNIDINTALSGQREQKSNGIKDGSGSEFHYRCSVKIKDGWKAWGFVVLDPSSMLFFIDEKPKTTMPWWSKARTRATNVGKVGTSKDSSTVVQGVSSSHRGVVRVDS
nr:hypothetical protein [Tanacetum cinerariifolium]